MYIRAPNHYAREVSLPFIDNPTEVLIKLDRSTSVSGRVVDVSGAPIVGARIASGYPDEYAHQARIETTTDANGHFSLEYQPQPGSTFYIAAAGHCLGIATLSAEQENVITLFPPRQAHIVVLAGNAPPKNFHYVLAAPLGGEFIPLGALYDVAELNGLTGYQLLGTGRDGIVSLPEFLPPGTYTLFVALKGGKPPWPYDKVGTLTLPAQKTAVFTFSED